MESAREEFDVQRYIAAVTRYWWVPLITAALGLLAAAGVLLLRSPTYTAEATLLVPSPSLLWRYDSAIQTVYNPRQDARDDVIAVAQTDDMAKRVITALGDRLPPDLRSPEQLSRQVRVLKSGDSFITIRARASSPDLAATIANTYAEQIRQRAVELQLQQDPLGALRTLLKEQEDDFQTAESNLEAYRAKTGIHLNMGGQLAIRGEQLVSGVAYVKNELILKNALLADYRDTIDRVRLFREAVQQARSTGTPLGQLPVELLDTQILRTRGRVTPDTVRRQTSIDALLALLDDEEAALSRVVSQLDQDVQARQAEIARMDLKMDRLEDELSLARESVNHLKRKIRELELAARVESSAIQLAAPALPPTHSEGLPAVPTLILAALLGLGVGIVLVLGWETLQPVAE
ncbi:MAG: hypothetical protein J7M34_12095 [Anaerolineae bacterium]|nr:hypothetical protein [Anaerolineae bacterium]